MAAILIDICRDLFMVIFIYSQLMIGWLTNITYSRMKRVWLYLTYHSNIKYRKALNMYTMSTAQYTSQFLAIRRNTAATFSPIS